MVASDSLVPLARGLVVPAEALALALDLEARGFQLQPDGSTLVVTPPERLTPQDCQQIRRLKRHLIALIDYRPPEVA
jgi:hypothetical protein